MARGKLRVYLGAAPGVGKTYAMLNEGRRRKGRGATVVVGYLETHGRKHTSEQLGDLELLRRFEPVIKYTEGELFLPAPVEDYLRGAALFVTTKGKRKARQLAPAGTRCRYRRHLNGQCATHRVGQRRRRTNNRSCPAGNNS